MKSKSKVSSEDLSVNQARYITARIYLDPNAEPGRFEDVNSEDHDYSNINLKYFKGIDFSDINGQEHEHITIESHSGPASIRMSKKQFNDFVDGVLAFRNSLGLDI